jgi:uncharacterized membrane protein
VSWEAEIIDDQPGQRLAWRSLPGAQVANEGDVRFVPAPGDRGTEVRVTLRYSMPGGRLGHLAARVTGEHPRQQLEDDLRRFKQVVETGEVVRSDSAPEGFRAGRQLHHRPGQPMTGAERDQVVDLTQPQS